MLNNNQYRLIKVDDLTLDVDNPRIKKWLEYYKDTPNESNIKLALNVYDQSENGTTPQSLKESIRAGGGINHPIIVNDEGERMVVIEGNTRLVIYQEFKESDKSGNWDKIPAIVYEKLDLEHIDAIRLQSHLVGPRAWDPYSKAKYLDHLFNAEHMTIVKSDMRFGNFCKKVTLTEPHYRHFRGVFYSS